MDYATCTNLFARANGAAEPVVGTGSVTLPCELKMSECLHVSNVTKNLLSARVSNRLDAFEAVLHIPGGSGHTFFIAKRVDNLHVFDCTDVYGLVLRERLLR